MGLADALDSGYTDPNAPPPFDSFGQPLAPGAPAPAPMTDQTSTSAPAPASPAALNYSPAGSGYTPATGPKPAAPPQPQGVGAYGAGAPGGAPAAGGLSPEMRARIANYGGWPAQPAGFTPTTQTAEVSPVSPGAKQSLDELEQARMEQAAAQQNYNVAAGQALQPLQAKQAKETAAFQQTMHQSLQEHVQKVQDLTDNASKAASEAPESFWGDNPGTRILRAIGMAGMAFGHGLNPNAPDPMAFMNSMIAQNAAKQKAKVEGAKGNLDRETNLYAMMKQKFGDDESAMTATQMLQKQAVLDKMDEAFQAPTTARTTWGTAPEKEDPEVAAIRAMPPTARLGLANARLALAADVHKDQLELDKAHVNKITSSEAYHRATGGGTSDPLAALKRVAEGEQYAATINTAGSKAAADVAHTEAETAKAAGAGNESEADKARFEQMAREVGSTAIQEHPVDWLMSKLGIQGTEGQKKELLREAYNSGAVADVLKTHKGLARNKDLFDKAVDAYLIKPGDTEGSIKFKQGLRRQNLIGQGGPSVTGVTEGEVQDTGDE